MKRKPIVILAVALGVSYAIIWAGVNYYFIPQKVIPQVQKFILDNLNGEVKLAVRDIRFHPFKGFILHKVELCGPVKFQDNYILRADLVDIDLDFLSLLWKKIEIKRFTMSGVDLNIGRDAKGAWNFSCLSALDLFKVKNDDYDIVVREFRVKDGHIDYEDHFKPDNTIQRRFTKVSLAFTSPKDAIYNLFILGSAKDQNEESLQADITYDKNRQASQGTVKFNTRYLSQYWDYYLDEWLKPWSLKADNIAAVVKFSLANHTLAWNGQYRVDKGTLSYGDFTIKGYAQIKHQAQYALSSPSDDITRLDLLLTQVSSLTGKYTFLDSGECTAYITKDALIIDKLTGTIKKRPVNARGKFSFAEPKELMFDGKISNVDNSVRLVLPSDNQGELDWQGRTGNSYYRVKAQINDLKDMASQLSIDSDINLKDFSELLMVSQDNISGRVVLSGQIKGEIDEPYSFTGGIGLKVRDFSILNLQAITFDSDITVKDGIFFGKTPRIDFYKGALYGEVKMDSDSWGVELHIDKLDIEGFAKHFPNLKGIKGTFSAGVACVSEWSDINTLQGGGYFRITDCDLRYAPVFRVAEEGISTLTKDFIMPIFKNVEGNFQLKDASIIIDNAICKSPTLSLGITGKCSFTGVADFTVGATILGGGFFKTARQIIFPYTIGVDLLANSVQVKISGRWPDLKHKAEVKTMNWLNDFFKMLKQISPNKYNLNNLWP